MISSFVEVIQGVGKDDEILPVGVGYDDRHLVLVAGDHDLHGGLEDGTGRGQHQAVHLTMRHEEREGEEPLTFIATLSEEETSVTSAHLLTWKQDLASSRMKFPVEPVTLLISLLSSDISVSSRGKSLSW